MDARRHAELTTSLASSLASATTARSLDACGRLAWLARHLTAYSWRLAALTALPQIAARVRLAEEALSMVELVAAAVEIELPTVRERSQAVARWRAVREAIADVRRGRDAGRVAVLRRTVREWRAVLAPADGPRVAVRRGGAGDGA
jgi:hypothetical protein